MKQYDLIVVGAGLSGAVLAHDFAMANKKVLVLEKRENIGGNVFDEKKENIMVHKYGPHIFHTDNEEVFKYMSQFWELNDFRNISVGNVKGKFIPIPFNFEGIDVFFPTQAEEIKSKLIKKFGENARVGILDLLQVDDMQLQEVAKFVYHNIFENYTTKMWDITPKEIDPSVMKRVPVTISYSKTYFQNKYEGIPKEGYTTTINKMLNHKNIEIRTKIDARELFKFENSKIYFEGQEFKGKVIYCGPIDELFNYKYGVLPYRSLFIQFKTLDQEHFQNATVVNYPADPVITRITEHKKFTNAKSPKTIISSETPGAFNLKSEKFNTPFYPITSDEGKKQFAKYLALAREYNNFYPLGRLATFQYLDMDKAIALAIELSKKLLKEERKYE